MDTKDLSVVSKWWASANEALELHRQRLAATPATAPAQEVGLTDEDIDAATRHLYHGGKPTSKEYRVGIVRAALRAKGQS